MNQDHIFIDVASDGDVIKALALVRTDRKGKVLGAFSSEVDSNLEQVVRALSSVILKPEYGNSYIVIAHFAEADRRILKENKLNSLFEGRAWLDTSQIAWPFVYNDMASERTLEALCVAFGIKNAAPDTATGDCEALVRLYWEMMSRYKVALIGEEVVRGFGGEQLRKFRDMVGI